LAIKINLFKSNEFASVRATSIEQQNTLAPLPLSLTFIVVFVDDRDAHSIALELVFEPLFLGGHLLQKVLLVILIQVLLVVLFVLFVVVVDEYDAQLHYFNIENQYFLFFHHGNNVGFVLELHGEVGFEVVKYFHFGVADLFGLLYFHGFPETVGHFDQSQQPVQSGTGGDLHVH